MHSSILLTVQISRLSQSQFLYKPVNSRFYVLPHFSWSHILAIVFFLIAVPDMQWILRIKINQFCYYQSVLLTILLFATCNKMNIHSNLASQLVEALNTIIPEKMKHPIHPNIQTALGSWKLISLLVVKKQKHVNNNRASCSKFLQVTLHWKGWPCNLKQAPWCNYKHNMFKEISI